MKDFSKKGFQISITSFRPYSNHILKILLLGFFLADQEHLFLLSYDQSPLD